MRVAERPHGLARARRAGPPSRAALACWCAAMVLPAAIYALLSLSPLAAIHCRESLDPQRFCTWWQHSRTSTFVGVPAVLALGCYASAVARSRRPVTVAAVLVVVTCA